MANSFVQPGENIDWTNGTSADVASGDVVVIGQQIGVALVDIADGAVGTVAMNGVFELPKASGSTINAGESVIWDVSAGEFDAKGATPAAGDVSACCVAWETKGSSTATIRVKLNVGIGTVTAGT